MSKGQTDNELYEALYSMGYDFGEYDTDEFDEDGFAETAVNLGYVLVKTIFQTIKNSK